MAAYPDPCIGTREAKALVRVEDGYPIEISNRPLEWRAEDGNRPTDEYLKWAGYYRFVDATPPSFDPNTEELVRYNFPEGEIDHEEGTVSFKYEVRELSAETILANQETKRGQVLGQRGEKLNESDWTILPDVPLENQDEWIAYRQLLRDLPETITDWYDVTWPNPPRLGEDFGVDPSTASVNDAACIGDECLPTDEELENL